MPHTQEFEVYNRGQRPTFRGRMAVDSKYTEGGTPTSPTSVLFELLYGLGEDAELIVSYTHASPEMTEVSEGVFEVQYTLNFEGWWQYRFSGSGSHIGVDWTKVFVRADRFG